MTDLQKRISAKVRQLGAGYALLGFGYVKTAVELAYNDETYLHNISKKLYPEIAKIYGVKPNNVDRSIRHYIEVIYKDDSISVNKALGVAPNKNSWKLPNRDFIATLIEALKCEE